MAVTARTASPQATRELAARMAGLAQAGDVILLAGEMGAGKTCFAQGFAVGLGIHEPVTSPTFTLVRTYPGTLDLVHADVYRLDHEQEVIDLGLGELVDGRGVALIEWGDAVAPALPGDVLEVRIEFDGDDDSRRLTISPLGRSWAGRLDDVARVLAEFVTAAGGARS